MTFTQSKVILHKLPTKRLCDFIVLQCCWNSSLAVSRLEMIYDSTMYIVGIFATLKSWHNLWELQIESNFFWHTLVTQLKWFGPSQGPYLAVAQSQNGPPIASLKSWHHLWELQIESEFFWHTLVTQLKWFGPSQGPYFAVAQSQNGPQIASLKSWCSLWQLIL